MGNRTGASESRSQIFFMLLSAGIFLYFGFSVVWNYQGVNGEFLLFVALEDWTLKLTGAAFAACALVAMVNGRLGNLFYAVVGLLSAIAFVIAGVLDILDTQHTAMAPILLFIFAVWNGYGSWMGVQEFLARPAFASSQETTDSRSSTKPSTTHDRSSR